MFYKQAKSDVELIIRERAGQLTLSRESGGDKLPGDRQHNS